MQQIVLGLALTALAPRLMAGDKPGPIQSLSSGKATPALRTSYEQVDDTAAAKTADTPTNRLVLGWRSGSWEGISAFVQFENLSTQAAPRTRI